MIEGFAPNFIFVLYFAIVYFFSDLLWTHPAMILINIAPFFTLCTARLIVCTVGKVTFNMLEDLHLSLPMLLSLVIFPLNKLLGLGLDEMSVFIMLSLANFFMYLLYVLNSIQQIKECLNIYCLTIKPIQDSKYALKAQ